MLKEELLTDEKGVSIPATASKVPLEDWVALLETSGWGAIEDTQFSYVEAPTSYKYPIGS